MLTSRVSGKHIYALQVNTFSFLLFKLWQMISTVEDFSFSQAKREKGLQHLSKKNQQADCRQPDTKINPWKSLRLFK